MGGEGGRGEGGEEERENFFDKSGVTVSFFEGGRGRRGKRGGRGWDVTYSREEERGDLRFFSCFFFFPIFLF